MRYAFIAEHRQQFAVRAMCRCLSIRPSGFYAWLKAPLSKRAREDARQTELLDKAWRERAAGSMVIASCTTTFLIRERAVAPTASPVSPS